jgi:PKD repeat protein
MKKLFTLLVPAVFTLLSTTTIAQDQTGMYDHVDGHREGENVNYCGEVAHRERMFDLNPDFAESYKKEQKAFSAYAREWATDNGEERGSNIVIPIVFHIIHVDGVENVDDAQIYDAVDVLNMDFNLGNADAGSVASYFQGWPTNVNVEFRLAQKKPNGQCFKGITRTYSTTTTTGAGGGWSNDQIDDVRSTHGDFPGDEYMNIYLVGFADGAAGYTMLPSGFLSSSMNNGIIILHNYVGRNGTGSLNRSRALTHEVGHWLNLSHVWGPNNNPGNSASCGDDDDVDDTPNTIGHTSCALTANTCSNESPFFNGADPIDNVENYMDYSYCSKMFTDGQAARMIAALNVSNTGRSNLWSPSNLLNTGTNGVDILCEAEFQSNLTSVCAGDTIDFTDLSFHAPSSWTWTFAGGTPASSGAQNPQISYTTPGTYAVTLNVGNGSGTVSTTVSDYITVLPATGQTSPFTEGFESAVTIPNSEWFIYNPSDGISWSLTTAAAYDGTKSVRLNNTSAVAGNIDALESTTFDLSSLSNVYLTFQYAYVEKSTQNNEKLKIYVSGDCGRTWSMRKQLSGSALPTAGNSSSSWTPSGQGDWKEVTVDNIGASYLTPNFRFKFEFESDGGNNIYLDNINLGATVSIAEEVSQIGAFNVYPNPLENNSVVNFDLMSNTNVTVEVYSTIGQKVADVASGSMTAGEHRFAIPTNDMAPGIYFIKLTAGEQAYTKRVMVR